MRVRPTSFVLVLGSLSLLPACHRSAADKLQGRWFGESAENIPSGELERVGGWVKGMALEFSGSKVTVTIPAETPRTGTYKVTAIDPGRMMIHFNRPSGGEDQAEFQFVGEDALRWSLGEGRHIRLIKAKN